MNFSLSHILQTFLLLFLIAVCPDIQSQIISISDKETGEPIQLATLTSENPRTSTVTNYQGQANISNFKGAAVIEIRVVGYEPFFIGYADLVKIEYKVALNQTTINLDEVVISASHWKQKTSELPNKVKSIQAKTIRLHNPQTTADLLALSGKVFIQKSQQGGGSPMIRGFATNRLLYTVDGVRMNTAIFRSGNIQNVISLDAFSLENTEVLFGAGSVVYGSDAIGGVMSFQTLAPQLSLKEKILISGRAGTRYSSANNEKTGHLDINIGWKKLASLSSFTYSDFDDLKMGRFGPDDYLQPSYIARKDSTDIVSSNKDGRTQKPSGYSQLNIMQKFKFSPNNRWDIDYGFHYSETSDFSRYDRLQQYENGIPVYGEWYYGPQKWMMNNLNITHKQSTLLYHKVAIRLAHQRFTESRISRKFNANDRKIRQEQVDALSLNIDFIKMLKKTRIIYGAEAIYNNVNSTGKNENIESGISTPAASRYPDASWQSYAVYASAQQNITEWANVHIGARYNQYMLNASFDTTFYPLPFTNANINNNALTGNIGMVIRPGNTWVISANLATAYRAPNVDDMGKIFDSEPGAVTVPNPDLKAEYAYNADLGVAKVFDDVLKIDISVYYTYLNNALVRRDYTLNGADSILYDNTLSQVQAIQNAAKTNIYGIQTGIELKLPVGFSFSSDVNFQKGTEELDNGTLSPSRHAPPWYGVSRLKYKYSKLNLQIYAVYNGEKSYENMSKEEKSKAYLYAIDNAGNPYSPSWTTLNFKAMYQLSDNFMLSAGVENITDQRYKPYSSGIAGPGRNFVLSVRAGF